MISASKGASENKLRVSLSPAFRSNSVKYFLNQKGFTNQKGNNTGGKLFLPRCYSTGRCSRRLTAHSWTSNANERRWSKEKWHEQVLFPSPISRPGPSALLPQLKPVFFFPRAAKTGPNGTGSVLPETSYTEQRPNSVQERLFYGTPFRWGPFCSSDRELESLA